MSANSLVGVIVIQSMVQLQMVIGEASALGVILLTLNLWPSAAPEDSGVHAPNERGQKLPATVAPLL